MWDIGIGLNGFEFELIFLYYKILKQYQNDKCKKDATTRLEKCELKILKCAQRF